MKITKHSLEYILKTGIPVSNFICGKIRFENKKITGTIIELQPVNEIGFDDNGPFVKIGVKIGGDEQTRFYRDDTDVEIFLGTIPDNYATFRPFDESVREEKATDVGELDRIKRILSMGLALRHFTSCTGWAIEAISKIDDEYELMLVFELEGDALMIGAIFHDTLNDSGIDFTSIMPTKEPTVPWLSEEDTALLHGEKQETA